jgi:hypothetical protein
MSDDNGDYESLMDELHQQIDAVGSALPATMVESLHDLVDANESPVAIDLLIDGMRDSGNNVPLDFARWVLNDYDQSLLSRESLAYIEGMMADSTGKHGD